MCQPETREAITKPRKVDNSLQTLKKVLVSEPYFLLLKVVLHPQRSGGTNLTT